MEVLGEAVGAQVEVDNLPLEGITLEHDGGRPSIEITVASRSGAHITHMVSELDDVWVKTEEGADQALELCAASATTLVTFRSALRADAVDGVTGR